MPSAVRSGGYLYERGRMAVTRSSMGWNLGTDKTGNINENKSHSHWGSKMYYSYLFLMEWRTICRNRLVSINESGTIGKA